MYLKHWSLERKPFGPYEQDMILFRGAFAEVYRLLSLAARMDPGAFWLVGPAGSGKTALLKSLELGLAGKAGFRLISTRFVTDGKRFRSLFGGLSGEESQDIELERLLESYFLGGEWDNMPAAVAVDGVDEIDDESLMRECVKLINLCAGETWPLSVIFSGRTVSPALQPTASRPAKQLDLPAPSEEEIIEIARHRLAAAGARKMIFTSAALSDAATLAEGSLTRRGA